MKRRWRLFLALALLLLGGGLLLLPQVRWPVYGWLRGEVFYRGRPAGYWAAEIYRLNNEPSWTNKVMERLGGMPQASESVGSARIDMVGVQYPLFVQVPVDLVAKDRAVIPLLVEFLRSGDAFIQLVAAGLLGRLGSDARPAIPALQEALKAGNEDVRFAARTALNWIDDDPLREDDRK